MRHWTEDELIESIYGVGPANGHLDTCAECRVRRRQMEQHRAARRAEPQLAPTVLAAQRRAVYSRAEGPASGLAWLSGVAAAGGVAVVAIALLVAPAVNRETRVETAASADAQLFAEAWAVVAAEEPRAAEPIHALFEEAP